MKVLLIAVIINLLMLSEGFPGDDCFIVQRGNHIIQQEGNCALQHPPCSTFKIAISLMGYNEGLLIDARHPEIPYQPSYTTDFGPFVMDAWKQAQNPSTWIQNSCVWYSQLLTQKLGMDKFKHYLQQFQYGNQNASGDPGKNNGLTHAWLSSSLQISPAQQVNFLQKLIGLQLPISKKAQLQTQKLFFLENLNNGWKLYGKTGTCFKLHPNGTPNFYRQVGWFIGWINKGNQNIVFAQYAQDSKKMDSTAGKRVKEKAIEKILNIINTI